MLIGQEEVKERVQGLIDSGNLPNTFIITGPKGSGKTELAKWITNSLEAPMYVPDDLKIDSIRQLNEDSRTISSPKVYLLDSCETMTMQAQNALLKLAEEPPENAYIIMTVQDSGTLLPTIISRSVTFRMGGYTRQELMLFTKNEELLDMAGNPGTIIRMKETLYEELLKHCRKVVDNIDRISVSNAFNILKSVDKSEYDLFISMLVYAYSEKVKQGVQCAKQLSVVHRTKNLLEKHSSINKQNALEMMFIELREVAISEVQ